MIGSTTVNGGGVGKKKVHEANWLLTRQSGVQNEPSAGILPEYGMS
jgi:hypothetical protein